MQTNAPPLLPLLRSKNQALILTRILLAPDRGHTRSELAAATGASLATVSREVRRAEEAGVVYTRGVGRSDLVVANPESPLTKPLTELLRLSFGPAFVAAEELSGIAGISAAYVYGSWAARYEGEEGPAPHDIDVLLIGEPDRNLVWAAADRIEARIGMTVQMTVRSEGRWADPTGDPFLTEVRSRPLVALDMQPGERA